MIGLGSTIEGKGKSVQWHTTLIMTTKLL